MSWRIEGTDGVVTEFTTTLNEEPVITLVAPDGNYAVNVDVVDGNDGEINPRGGAAIALFEPTSTPTPLPTVTPTPTPTVTPTLVPVQPTSVTCPTIQPATCCTSAPALVAVVSPGEDLNMVGMLPIPSSQRCRPSNEFSGYDMDESATSLFARHGYRTSRKKRLTALAWTRFPCVTWCGWCTS